MQYQVPQFIEVEDKIFGPFTLKQFIYLAGGGGICLIFFTLFPFYVFFALSIPVVAFAAALAFYKVNGRPFIVAVEHAVGYFFASKLYLWQQREQKQNQQNQAAAAPTSVTLPVPKLSESKLRDLSWSLNIKDRQSGEQSAPRAGFEI